LLEIRANAFLLNLHEIGCHGGAPVSIDHGRFGLSGGKTDQGGAEATCQLRCKLDTGARCFAWLDMNKDGRQRHGLSACSSIGD
jgi:hypothetical protein